MDIYKKKKRIPAPTSHTLYAKDNLNLKVVDVYIGVQLSWLFFMVEIFQNKMMKNKE